MRLPGATITFITFWYTCVNVILVAESFTLGGQLFARCCGTLVKARAIKFQRRHEIYASSSNKENDSRFLLKGYRRPLHWVIKSCSLEETLDFYSKNFNFAVYRHEEFATGCEATCNGPYGGAWSKTMIGPANSNEGNAFCIEVTYNYGITSYEKGNDLRYIAMLKSSFKGNNDFIICDDNGRFFLESPDGHYIRLLDDQNEIVKMGTFSVPSSSPTGQSSQDFINPFVYISLSTSNLSAAKQWYTEALGMSIVEDVVTKNGDSIFVSFVGKKIQSCEEDNFRELSNVLIELVPLGSSGDTLLRGAWHGRMAIETEDGAPTEMSEKARQLEEIEGSGRKSKILHGPLKLQPHGEEVVILTDDDGHEYCFVDARGFQNCIDVTNQINGRTIDWNYRRGIEDKARDLLLSSKALDLGPFIRPANASNFDEMVTELTSPVSNSLISGDHLRGGLVVEFYAPWCVLCQKRKAVLQRVAQRLSLFRHTTTSSTLAPSNPPFITAAVDSSDKVALANCSSQLHAMNEWAKLQGFPFLFFISKSDVNNPIPFEGKWTEEAIVEWVEKEAGLGDQIPPLNASVNSEIEGEKGENFNEDEEDCDECSL